MATTYNTLESVMTIGNMPDYGYPQIMCFTIQELKTAFPRFTNNELIELIELTYDYFLTIGLNGGYTKLYCPDFELITIGWIKATMQAKALFDSTRDDHMKYKEFYDRMITKYPAINH